MDRKTTRHLDVLIRETVSSRNGNAIQYNRLVRNEQRNITATQRKLEEFVVYANVLTQLLGPYTGPKHASNLYRDTGQEDTYHGKRKRLPVTPDLSTCIGSVDYLAAAEVDPAFKKLWRQYVAVNDTINKTKQSEELDRFEDAGVVVDNSQEPQFGTDLADVIRGFLSSADDKRSFGLVGARDRLAAQLDRRFKFLMRTQSERVSAFRDYFIEEFKRYAHPQIKPDSAFKTAADLERQANDKLRFLRKVAYLKMLGHDSIIVPRDSNLASAVDAAVQTGKYANGNWAPTFAEVEKDGTRLAVLDSMIFEQRHARPVKQLNKKPTIKLEPSLPTVFAQRFLTEARRRAKSPAPL